MTKLTFDEKLIKYADMIVKIGCGLVPGQPIQITCPVTCVDFGRVVAERAYIAGASEVIMNYVDTAFTKIRNKNADISVFENPPQFLAAQKQYLVDKGSAFVIILSFDPQAYMGMDFKKMAASKRANAMLLANANKQMSEKECTNCAVAIPHKAWADKVFPNDENSMEKLWDMIFASVRVGDFDVVEAWKTHQSALEKRTEMLNNFNFKTLHYTNKQGTDLTIDLADNHIWCGGAQKTSRALYYPNMPTEEVFTAPSKFSANGKLVATMPLEQGGDTVEEFYLEFKEGKVVDFDAKKGKQALADLLTIENANYLGEVALVAHDSPISNLNTLFFNTLFDENASCHFALGTAIPYCIKGGATLSDEQKVEAGINVSRAHVDFMVGSSDLDVVGTTACGDKIQIFKNGNWSI